ncbi:DeoR/GlpR family DNA-binding transcription regulator [Streptococcus uberis]|uniref:DeoR/GlpR family DNA-binding transcription regulator n=1 Tax=Streptococcus uberis TaxID=1349 RepID=UPI001FF5E9B2|nr:DeoR/GlpR family DNA-binding transcription regulator [Streptococcus uberis]MCK1169568.1 DeoR/GlpR family DNA-binding transcription regulator [Streptococcus uberis]MCK1187833.1 DeoR/GlpR family DNA-binding transcription regulator [Streptococcus uberis]MCK1200682.1 DeoR/GlpR family DNA-binding transcription regulator [Streptococcus uberis]MCK1206009.1 DeoR/GlpR family DNA-binding transcription regulator [Streptococcus uberis]MCK1243207.1 DeoR/GlpR family DNA-binding transcription regulator [S
MNRLEKIIQLVSDHKRIDVNSLSELLSVSKVTVRKDLDKLESKGLLRREHGYAVLNSGDDLNVRLSYNYNVKRKIAEKAAELVQDNDTIMIESGSTCALLAEVLCQTKRNIKIITNSCFIANFLRQYDSCQIILLGGNYQPNSEVTVGPLLKQMVDLFHVDRVFAGTDGFSPEVGFMCKDMMRCEGVQYMADAAEETIILTDSSKFSKPSLVHQLSLDRVSRVITDKELDEENRNLLGSFGIALDFV